MNEKITYGEKRSYVNEHNLITLAGYTLPHTQ